jgi:hypothetical protein
VFGGMPVFVPIWWGRFDPGFSRAAPSAVPASARGSGAAPAMPHLPGSDFAASIAHSTQTFAGGVLGSVTAFSNRITNATNPVPVSTSTGGGGWHGGGGCACACACAGCACACAGGGR